MSTGGESGQKEGGDAMDNLALAQSKYAQEQMAGICSTPRWTLTERLEGEKRTLEDRLAQVNKLLDALSKNPGFQELFDLISKHA